MQRIPKTVFIFLIIGLGVFNFISISIPTININTTQAVVDYRVQRFETQRDIRYPMTVEKDWNQSIISYGVRDEKCYIYWIIPVHENREVDFHINAPVMCNRYVFTEPEFINYQNGIDYESIVERDMYNRGTLSFECNRSENYVFVCSNLTLSEMVPVRVSWVFSNMGDLITRFRIEVEYGLRVESRVILEKVSFVEKLVLDYSKWSPF